MNAFAGFAFAGFAFACALALVAAGCDAPAPDWDRMLAPAHARAFQATDLFPDGRVMRAPPAGTVPVSARIGDAPALTGREGARFVTRIPTPLSAATLARGRDRFDIFCAACHGLRGDGDSPVARNMELRRPPSLVDGEVRAFPPGRVFQVVTQGYGLMPSYAAELAPDDRWAVVAYVRALQLARRTRLDALPPALRDEARKALP
jgi:mono/diheme cytochrome c family protein